MPADVHHGRAPQLHQQRAAILDAAYASHSERFIRKAPQPPALPAAAWINNPEESEPAMTLELINPQGLPDPGTYSHVAIAAGTRIVFIAGQEPEDSHGRLTGPGDLAAQAGQVFANLGVALAAAGVTPRQVAKITIYVVGHRPEYLPVIEAARVTLFGDHKPPDTLVGVETLSQPGYLIEVDAIAVIQLSSSLSKVDIFRWFLTQGLQ